MQGHALDFEKLVSIHTRLKYRIKAMDTADIYLGIFGLPGPGGLKCSQWDLGEWSNTQEAKQFNDEQFSEVLNSVANCHLFPQSIVQQDQPFTKLNTYLAVALMVAKLEPEKLKGLLKEFTMVKDKAIADQVEEFSRYRTIRTAGKSYFSTLGKRFRSLSPISRDRKKSNPTSPKSPGKGRRMSLFGRASESREE